MNTESIKLNTTQNIKRPSIASQPKGQTSSIGLITISMKFALIGSDSGLWAGRESQVTIGYIFLNILIIAKYIVFYILI